MSKYSYNHSNQIGQGCCGNEGGCGNEGCCPPPDPCRCWYIGPTGPTGPSGSANTGNAGIVREITNKRSTIGNEIIIKNGDTIYWDYEVSKINDKIRYNHSNGNFTFKLPGHYYINYWINVVPGASLHDFQFEFYGSTSPVVIASGAGGSSGSPTSTIMGQGIINVKAEDYAHVEYVGSDSNIYGDISIQGYISIFYIGE